MSKIKNGDKIKIKKNDKTGVIETVYDLGYWHMSEDQYCIKMDDGSGVVTLSDSDIEKIEEAPNWAPKCECGQSNEVWVKHSDYCPLYAREE